MTRPVSPPAVPPTMRAAILYGREDVRVERIPVPTPGPGELLLKVEAALTCGTDLKVFRRGYHAAMITPPSVFGHEMAGTVAAVGTSANSVEPPPPSAREPRAPSPGEKKQIRRARAPAAPSSDAPAPFPVGTRLVVANSAPCGECFYCRGHQENLCDDLQFLNGAYAEYLLVPARFVQKNALPIPDRLSFAAAALTEPLACVVHGLDEVSPRAGSVAAVIGLGPIGLMFVALLKARGATVAGVERLAARMEAARTLGADAVLEADAEGRWEEALRQRYPRLDLVIEATGRPEGWELALRLVRKGGRVNLFGGCPAGTKIQLDTERLHYQQLTVTSSFHHRPASVRAALAALAAGVVPAAPFLSGEKTLEELPALLREMTRANPGVKTCILPAETHCQRQAGPVARPSWPCAAPPTGWKPVPPVAED